MFIRLKCSSLCLIVVVSLGITLAQTGLEIQAAAQGQADSPKLVQPVARTDQNSRIAHSQLLEKTRQGAIDIYFEGDSITRRWGALDYPELLAH